MDKQKIVKALVRSGATEQMLSEYAVEELQKLAKLHVGWPNKSFEELT